MALENVIQYLLLPELELMDARPAGPDGRWGTEFLAKKRSEMEVCPRCAQPSRSVYPWPTKVGIDEYLFKHDFRLNQRRFVTMVVDHKNKRLGGTALKLASRLGDASAPAWIGNANECIRIVELVQANPIQRFVQGVPEDQYEAIFDAAFSEWAGVPDSAPGIESLSDRMNFLLRLWAGCVWSGKFVAYETRSGVTEPSVRAWFFSDIVAPRVALCQVYKAGVMYAVDWKRSFEPPQAVVLDGVPDGHVVRQRYDAGLVR